MRDEKMNELRRKYYNPGATKIWDTVNLEYPVRTFPGTGIRSKSNSQVLLENRKDTAVKSQSDEVILRHGNSQHTRHFSKSQTNIDFHFKPQTVTERFCHATSSAENSYIHGGTKKLNAYPFKTDSYGTSEMRSSYQEPNTPTVLKTDMAEYKHPHSVEPHGKSPDTWCDRTPIPTSSDSYLKHLDPYVSTTHLDHRPFTAEHLNSLSATKDVITYYTYANVPRVRGPRPYTGEWWWPKSTLAARPMSDREKFKFNTREVRVPNQLHWVPTSFRTETASKFIQPTLRPESKVKFDDATIKKNFRRTASNLRTENIEKEALFRMYTTESRDMNSGRPLTAVIDQEIERNRFYNR